MGVDSTTYLADAKIVYGAIQDQVSTLPAIMNLFGDGSKFGKPINNIGIRGYVFLARLQPNWSMGYRMEGTTGVGAAGNQGLKNSTVILKYAYVPITITGQAENLTKGESRAFMQAKALEAKFDMKDIVSLANVVVAGANRGGELARAAAPIVGGVSFTADDAGGLPGAIYLRAGQVIDTMAVGGGAKSVDSVPITAINYGTRVVTVAGTAVAGEAVALEDSYPVSPGNFPITAEGLLSLISDTGAIQGLNPATAGEESWASYVRNVSGVLSSSELESLVQLTKNRGGEDVDILLFPSAQINQLTNIATTTLRFNTDQARTKAQKKALDLGFTVYYHGGRMIIEDKDLRPDRIYAGASSMMKKFEAIPLSLAEDEAGTWTRVSGTGGVADAVSGLLRWYHQIGLLQRSAWGLASGLTVPASFTDVPATI